MRTFTFKRTARKLLTATMAATLALGLLPAANLGSESSGGVSI